MPIVVPGLSASSASSATPTSLTSVAQEEVTPTLHPASTRSESTSSTVRGSPSHEPAETENTNKNGDSENVRGNRCLIGQNGSKNLRRIWWMKVFQLTGTHPRILLVNQLQSREEKWCRASIFTLTSRRTETATSASEPKLQGLQGKRTGAAVLRAEDFGDSKITKFLVKGVNLETIIDTQSWYRIWLLNEFQSYPCKTKTSQETERSLQKFLEPNRKPKVIYTDNSLEFGNACEDFTGITVRQHLTVQKQKQIAERAVRRMKEGTSAVLL